ncbi:MAG: hypothetical protein ACHQZS_09145 [Candidatus Binatales bacterium]
MEALATKLAESTNFDPASIDSEAIRAITLSLVAELVFLSVAADACDALDGSSNPAVAIERENGLHSLVREVVDVEGTPVLDKLGSILTPAAVAALISRLIEAVEKEMETW